MMLNLKTAVRSLFKNPGFSVIAVATIAIGIGANTALVSVFDQLVLHPVNIPHPSNLITIQSINAQGQQVPNVSWPRYEEIRNHATFYQSIGISAFETFTLTGEGEPQQLNSQRIDPGFLPSLGIMPARGRNFTRDEDAPNGPAVCIISHEFWQTRLGGRDNVIGSSIELNGAPWQIVGVLPPRMTPPFAQVQVFAPRVFEVTGLTAVQVQVGSIYAQGIARLKPGVTMEQALAELTSIGNSYKEQFGSRLDGSVPNQVQTYVDSLVGGLQPTFYTLLAAVGFVLLIACFNVASLFLGRLSIRQREIAVRMSLGARRGQIISQLMTESLVFSLIAGGVGTLLAVWAISAIQSTLGNQLPPNTTLEVRWIALAFTALISLVSAVFVGLAPAWQASKAHVVEALKEGVRGSTMRGGRFRAVLIVAEVALSVVLLVGSALLLMSFLQLQQASPGFDSRGVASSFVNLPRGRYATPAQQVDFFDRAIEALESRPGVTQAAAVMGLPMTGFTPRSPYAVGGRPIPELSKRPLAGLEAVTPHYFAMLSIPFVEGRAFNSGDSATAPKVSIINEQLAKRLFPGESALGHTILRGPNSDIAAEIVGVIKDVRTLGMTVPVQDEVYYPVAQLPRPGLALVARTTGDAAALQKVIDEAVRSVDKNEPTTTFATMEANVAASLGTQRLVASLTAVFAGIALLLSAVGLYSVLAYAVSQRTNEIGIRMALGAKRGEVIGLIMTSGLRLVVIGLTGGLVAAAGAARLIQSLLFDVAPLNPAVYAGVAVLFLAVAAAACVVPSLRASRIDPLVALQAE